MISQTRGGGSARVPWYLAREQARLGHNVTIYSSTDRASMEDAPPGVELRLFKCVLNFMGGLRVTPTMLFTSYQHFDIVHMHNYRTIPNLIASIFDAPFVLQAHGSCLPIPEPRHLKLLKTLNDKTWQNGLIKRARRLIACNDYEIEQYIAEGASREQCVRMDLGIDLAEYDNLPAKTPSAYKTILFLGKFHEIKGPDILLRAFSHLDMPNVKLVMAGWDDGYELYTRALTNTLHLDGRVEFRGFIDGPEKVQAYVDADVVVFPSRYEAFGMGIIEAAACGTPVVLTKNCAISDRIPIYCGVASPLSEMWIASCIKCALDGKEHPDIRQHRIAWARHYNWDRIAGEMVEIYQESVA